MKNTILSLTAAFAFSIAGGPALLGQDTIQTTTTTTAAGTISDFGPQAIVVRTDSDPQPERYTFSRSTVYVDQNGNPVSVDVVKSGLPVTVYYVRQGDDLIASKVIVRTNDVPIVPAPAVQAAPVVPAAPPVEEYKSTTTTTTTTNK
jgi:hypothetical protein